MTCPNSDDSSVSPPHAHTPGGHRRERLVVARRWAQKMGANAYIPLPYAEIESRLLDMVNRLFDAMLHEPFRTDPAADVGVRLVAMNCVLPCAFERTVDLLGKALLNQPELRQVRRRAEKALALLGAFSAAHSEALRLSTLRQQADLNRTLIRMSEDAQSGLRAGRAQLDAILASAAAGIAIVDDAGRFVRVNPALGQILGHSTSEFANLTLFDVLVDEEAPFVKEACERLLSGTTRQLRQRRRMVDKGGDQVPVTLTVAAVPDEERPTQLAVIVQDDTELILLQRQLTRQSLHDVVTGLPNRQFFTTRLERALHNVDPDNGATVYHLDLDAFSLVADGLGRQVGDQLLKVVAERLKSVMADERAVVARLEGDEFAILVENSPTTPDIATTVGRINEELAEPVYIDGHGVTVSTSIGVVHRPRRDLDPTELLRASDLALRRAKDHGRRQWELFDAGQDARDRVGFTLATTMSSAWEMGEIDLEYRPRVELRGERVVGLSARLRWDHPEYGPLGHERCVDLAERTGLMLPLGDWMLRTACLAAQRRQRENGVDMPVSVGLSAGQAVDPDLVCRTLAILTETGTEPGQLRVGFPVRMLAGERPEPAENLRVLAEEGIGVMLDDFGGATADLACLEDLPVDTVRLNRGLADDQARRSLTRPADQPSVLSRALSDLVSVIHLAGGVVIVNGVDSAGQADWWRHTGADQAEGARFTTW